MRSGGRVGWHVPCWQLLDILFVPGQHTWQVCLKHCATNLLESTMPYVDVMHGQPDNTSNDNSIKDENHLIPIPKQNCLNRN